MAYTRNSTVLDQNFSHDLHCEKLFHLGLVYRASPLTFVRAVGSSPASYSALESVVPVSSAKRRCLGDQDGIVEGMWESFWCAWCSRAYVFREFVCCQGLPSNFFPWPCLQGWCSRCETARVFFYLFFLIRVILLEVWVQCPLPVCGAWHCITCQI